MGVGFDTDASDWGFCRGVFRGGGVTVGILEGKVPVVLGDGVDGHDFRVAGKGEDFGGAFFGITGFRDSFLEFEPQAYSCSHFEFCL